MDHQGRGPSRPPADPRRQPPPAGTGPLPARSPGQDAGSGAQRILGPGTGPQRLIGSATGANTVLSRDSGAQPLPNRDSGAQPASGAPTGGFPAGGFPADTTATNSFPEDAFATGSFGRTPARGVPPGREPTGPSPVADGYRPDDTDPIGRPAPDAGDQVAPPRRRRGSAPKRRLRSRMAWLTAGVLVAAAVGIAGYKFLYEARVNAPVSPTLRLPTSAPASPGFDKTLGKWQHIGTRAEDPEPLTITQLFPPQFALDGASYVRTAASVTKTCSLAVYGTDLQAALQSGHCTQVLRASYISGDGKMMGTVGVVNLVSSSAAQKAGQVTGPQEIIAPLTGKKGATSKLGNGTGVVQAEIKGHYLILMWAEYANLKSPSGSAQRQALEQFAANLVTGTANIDLSTRMLTGKG